MNGLGDTVPGAGDVARVNGDEPMNAIGVDEHLAHLLLVQGGLLDAYLEQNLGRRYAYVIAVCEADYPRRVRTVTNFQQAETVRPLVRHLASSPDVQRAEPIAVERSPRFCDVVLEG